MTDHPHAKLLEEVLTRLIGEFYATDTALNGYTDGVMAKWIAPRLAAALETAQPTAPDAWLCPHHDNKVCSPEGCPKGFCARNRGWSIGDPSPPECTGHRSATPLTQGGA